MGIPVTITNSEITQWYQNQNDDRAALQTQTTLLVALQLAQLLIYYDLWDEAVDNRDKVIDKYLKVQEYLHNTDLNIDYPQLLKKQEVLDLPLPDLSMCTDSILFHTEVHNDGDAIDAKCEDLAEMDCCGVPDEWKLHEGDLYAARAHDYTGGILANSSKRRVEAFRENKTRLILQAQRNSKMAISPILQNYTQAISIYEGLASTFLEGFNSAGAGLGVNVARLGEFTSSGSNSATSGFADFSGGATTVSPGGSFFS